LNEERPQSESDIYGAEAQSRAEAFIDHVVDLARESEKTGSGWEKVVREQFLVLLVGPFRRGQVLTAAQLNSIHQQLSILKAEIQELKKPKKLSSVNEVNLDY
jgi:hypothetical protein